MLIISVFCGAKEKDDDLTVEGCLRYWGDTAQDVLHLEDDEYYRSDFTKMIIVNAMLQQEKIGDMEVMTCSPYWDASKGLKPTMSDKELGLENTLDDGTTKDRARRSRFYDGVYRRLTNNKQP